MNLRPSTQYLRRFAQLLSAGRSEVDAAPLRRSRRVSAGAADHRRGFLTVAVITGIRGHLT